MSARNSAHGIGHRQYCQTNASETPTKPIPTPGNAAANTALPQPPKTNQNVPKNSAESLIIKVPL